MFNFKNRVEEDLERIRRANLLPDKSDEEFVKKQEKSSASDEKLNLEKNDLTAMILAVFSLILPYFLVFVGIMGLSVYLISKFFV